MSIDVGELGARAWLSASRGERRVAGRVMCCRSVASAACLVGQALRLVCLAGCIVSQRQ